MVGRKVRSGYHNISGTVLKWEPLSQGCDVFLEYEYGAQTWLSSNSLEPTDGLGPLPSRSEVVRAATQEAVESLRSILDKHLQERGQRWPGSEFGKTIIGQALYRAIAEIQNKRSI